MNRETLKTDLTLITSAVFQGTTFVFWAYFLAFLSKPVFLLYWSLAATFVLGAYLVWKKDFKFSLRGKSTTHLLIFAILSGSSVGLLTIGVDKVGAALASFIMPSGILFTILLAAIFHRERFSNKEVFSMLIIILGLFLFNWRNGNEITTATLIILLAALLLAISHNVAKPLLTHMKGMTLNWIRLFSIVPFGLVYLLLSDASFVLLSLKDILVLLGGVLIGPIAAFTVFYGEVQRSSLSKALVLKDISPIFTLIFAYVFLGEIVESQQLLSGLVILGGALLILSSHRKAT